MRGAETQSAPCKGALHASDLDGCRAVQGRSAALPFILPTVVKVLRSSDMCKGLQLFAPMGDRCVIDGRSMRDRWAIDGRSMRDRTAKEWRTIGEALALAQAVVRKGGRRRWWVKCVG